MKYGNNTKRLRLGGILALKQYQGLTCLITVLLLFRFIPATSQLAPSEIARLLPDATRSIGISDGLPTDCFEQILIDQMGRLWLTTCGDAQRNRSLHLVQFDGWSGDLHSLGFKPKASFVVGGMSHDSLLTGINLQESEVVQYAIHSQIIKTFRPEESGYAFYNIKFINDRIFILALRGDSHVILEFKDQQFTLLNEIPKSELDLNLDYLIGLFRRVHTIGNEIIFFDQKNHLYRFNVETLHLESYEIPVSLPISDIQVVNWNDRLCIGIRKDDKLKFMQLDNGRFIELSILPLGWTYSMDYPGAKFLSFISADQAGWLFVNCRDNNDQVRQLLIHADGRMMDYSAVYNAIEDGEYGLLASIDFSHSLYTLSGKLVMVEVKQDYEMQRVKTFPARAMIPWVNQQLLVLTDVMPQIINTNIDPPTISNEALPNILYPSDRKSIVRDQFNNVWFVDYDTLKQWNINEKKLVRWPLENKVEILTSYKDRILFLNDGSLLYSINHAQATIQKINFSGSPNLIEGIPNAMMTQGSLLWIATTTGLWKADLENETLEKIAIQGFERVSLLTLFQSQQGDLYLGTEAQGVIQWNPTSEEVRSCNHADGLSHNTVVGILEDDSGLIWANTFYGINVLNQQMEPIASFFTEDGMIHNEGNRWSCLKLEDGRLVFGSVDGLTFIDPEKVMRVFRQNTIPSIYVKSIAYYSRGSKNKVLQLNPDFSSRIFKLSAETRHIQISVGVSEYVHSKENEFIYRIDKPGFDWVAGGNQPYLQINNLPYGKFDLHIKGRNKNGTWTSNMVKVSLDVARPFYMKWWFYGLCSLPFIGFLALWFWKARQEQLRLEKVVKLRTAEISRQADELKNLDKAKTRIYTNITHEFRTPLTVIMGTSELIEDNEDKKKIIRRNSDRLLNLVNQLLELSKLESGHMTTNIIRTDLVKIIRDLFESFVPMANERDIGMHFYSKPESLLMDLDLEMIYRIAGNLLSNALKFTPAGGNIFVHIDVQDQTVSNDISSAVISVRDTGIGIPSHQVDKIFNRFYQADDTTTRAGEGTGIGLALTKELLDFLGGKIEVNSKEGQGSEFVVTLPITQDAAITEEITALQHISDSSGPSVKYIAPLSDQLNDKDQPAILIVEDNADVIHYLGSCLQGSYRIHIAMDGQDGFEKAVELVPDLIISDVMMPVKDGIQLCEDIKQDEHTSHIPVILLTAKADFESRIQGLERGADAYMAKPFDKVELLLKIRNLIDSRKAMRGYYLGQVVDEVSTDPSMQLEKEFVNRVNEIIASHLDDENFGVTQLSYKLKYSRSQVLNKVKALTGLSTSAYIQHRRMQYAKTLLAGQHHTISEVAYAVGFRDPSYFARVFRREFGISPTDFVDDSQIS